MRIDPNFGWPSFPVLSCAMKPPFPFLPAGFLPVRGRVISLARLGCALLTAETLVAPAAAQTPNDGGNIERPLRYRPDGQDFLIENGTGHFNRPLYGPRTAFRVDASDGPPLITALRKANIACTFYGRPSEEEVRPRRHSSENVETKIRELTGHAISEVQRLRKVPAD